MNHIKILSIEPTPSPNVMKLNVDETLPSGVSRNFTKVKQEGAPDYISNVLAMEGVVGVFQVSDFLAVERHPKADWKEILGHIGKLFGEDPSLSSVSMESPGVAFGEVQVFVQMFKGIPMQVKLTADAEEMRFGLPEVFGEAVMKIQKASQNLLLERTWADQGVRYGTFKEIGEEIVGELAASYDQDRLHDLVIQATGNMVKEVSGGAVSGEKVGDLLDHPDWEKRFAALDRINPTVEDISVLAKALEDSKTSIRRLATVYLGMVGKTDSLPHLFKALKDKSAAVRRTAGDALSDIGDPLAIGAMAEALQDPNKLVRWRAARFLFEVGDASALAALQQAQEDPEFEVSLQAKMAVERIERGEAASGTVWQQMTRNMNEPDNK